MGNRQDICILGGTGNVGYAAYKALEKSNYYFRIGVRNRDKAEKMNLYKRDNVQLFEIDLDKSSSVNEFCDGANIIIGAIGPSTKYSEKMLKIALEMKIPYIDPGGMYLKNKYSNREIDIRDEYGTISIDKDNKEIPTAIMLGNSKPLSLKKTVEYIWTGAVVQALECLFSMDKTKKMQMAQYQIFVSRLWSEISRKTGYLNLVNYNNSGNNEEIFDELQKKGLLEEKIFV